MQDALSLLHLHVGKLRAVAAFSGWMFAIVRRECIRLAKRGPRLWQPLATIEDDLRFSVRPDIELRLDLAAAIGSLPGHYRQVLILRDMEELTIADIGAQLGATHEAVKARLHRARGLVREYLEK